MKNHFFAYSLFVFLLFSAVSVTAQVRMKDDLQDGNTLIMMTPQHLYVSQIRIEIDRKINDQQWLTLAPLYIQKFEQYQERQGFGLVATYKYVLKNQATYFGGGLQFMSNSFDNYALDDLLDADDWLYRSKVMQYGVNVLSGYYYRLYPFLYGDIYYGVGYRFSQTTSTDGNNHNYNEGMLSPAYKGLTLVFGIRIGVML
jgi:hypothetical protein